MSKYIVRDVVCDWGICSVDDLGKEELVEVCNSKANAELICEILNADLMKDGKYTIWKDKKISDLEAKLAESEKKAYSRGHSQRDIDNEIKLNALREDVANKEKRIVELKQQLAEKDEKIEKLKSENHALMSENAYQEADVFELTQKLAIQDQDKISFAVEQLEKVKELLNTDFESTTSWIDPYEDGEYLNSMSYNHNNTIEIIDNQIKALKEGK